MIRKHLFAMASISVLGLATAVGSANAISLAPIGTDTNVIQVQDRGGRSGGEMNRGGGSRSGGGALSGRSGADAGARRGGEARGVQIQRNEGTRVQRNDGPRAGSGERVSRSGGGDVRRSMNRGDGDRQSRNFNRGHRHVHRGWSRDPRHIFYGAALIGVPFGYAAYASHPCYDWLPGPRGVGYYWNYDRCPV